MRELGTGIWVHDGPAVEGIAGFHFPTRMVVVRLSAGADAGKLWVWSPTTPDPETRAAVDALGPVAHLVAPNLFHHMALPDWIAAYPDAQVHGAPRLADARPDIAFHTELADTAPPLWADDLDQLVMRGNKALDEVAFFHRPSGTVILCDLIQQMPRGWYRGWRGLVARLDGMTGDHPQVPRKFRMAFRDKRAARESRARLLAWPAERLIIAHGPITEARAQETLRGAFAFLG